LTGSTGIGVIIIDSGIAPSANFGSRIAASDFVKGSGKSSHHPMLRPGPNRRIDEAAASR
jgi:hypothetical protein